MADIPEQGTAWHRSERHPGGFALLIVLWAMVLLGLLGSTITAAGRAETRLAGNLRDAAGAEAAADGAVAVAVYHLLDATPAHWLADGAPHAVLVGDASVTLSLRDQGGKVDPNESSPALIAALLRQLGLDVRSAQAGADAIVDWRSVADGGLDPAYAAQNRAFGPPHEPFQSTEEIGLVMGMTPRLLAALRPHVDVFLQATPDPALADPVVTAAIADATRRDRLTLEPVSSDGPAIIAVEASAQLGGARYVRHALIRFDATATRPYQVLEWSGP